MYGGGISLTMKRRQGDLDFGPEPMTPIPAAKEVTSSIGFTNVVFGAGDGVDEIEAGGQIVYSVEFTNNIVLQFYSSNSLVVPLLLLHRQFLWGENTCYSVVSHIHCCVALPWSLSVVLCVLWRSPTHLNPPNIVTTIKGYLCRCRSWKI